jgi:hypothetical protein
MIRQLPSLTADDVYELPTCWKKQCSKGDHAIRRHISNLFYRFGKERIDALDVLTSDTDDVRGPNGEVLREVDRAWLACHMLPADYRPSWHIFSFDDANPRACRIFYTHPSLEHLKSDLLRYVAGDPKVRNPDYKG